MPQELRIDEKDFMRMFDCASEQLPGQFYEKLKETDTRYHFATRAELEEYLSLTLRRLESPGITRTLEENHEVWENGWQENLQQTLEENGSMRSLTPRYYRQTKFLRYSQDLAVSGNLNLEHDLFTLARYAIFSKYLQPYENLYEIGCGSCQNLLILSDMFPEKKLHGLDWARPSVQIAEYLASSQGRKISGSIFDMITCQPAPEIEPHSAVLTIHAVEQIGTQHSKLLSFLLAAKPEIVVHYEPTTEFYDLDNFLDYLAFSYSRKRNYLSGFWPALCQLRDQGKIEILEARRPQLGGVFHEASVIVWRPIQ